MLASTVQFSTYDQTPPTHPRQTRDPPRETRRYENRRALQRSTAPVPREARSLRTQQRAYNHRTTTTPVHTHRGEQYWEPATAGGRTGQRSTLEHHPTRSADHSRMSGRSWCGRGSAPPAHRLGGEVLLRKEVIQPHLPVRLPCYDFVPIADPAFDGSLHKGWATGFGRYRLS